MKRLKPKRPYDSMEHAARKLCWSEREEIFDKKFDCDNQWPCIQCYGRGYLHEWTGIGSDYNDEDCLACHNTGIITRQKFKTWYDETIKYYCNALNEWKQIYEEFKRITKKLTKKELEFLKQNL